MYFRILRQPLVGIAVGALAVGSLVAAWSGSGPVGAAPPAPTTWLLMAGLLVATVLAYQFPIHINYRLKVELFTVPTYLMAVLLPLPLSGLVAALGITVAELTVRTRRGTYWSDIATEAGRMTIAVLLASLVMYQRPGAAIWTPLPLIGAAVVMWICEVLTLPLLVGPVTGETPRQILLMYVHEAGALEGVQYVLGLLGALVMTLEPAGLLLLLIPCALVYRAFKSATEIHDSTRALLENMADVVDLRDPYTGGHSRRVAQLCEAIICRLAIANPDADLILTAARLHDIGKIGIPDAILNKPGVLTADERSLMETHTDRGADLLVRYPGFTRGAAIVRHHHERWDGKGYPQGLKGSDIPLGARILAVADSFDAMTSDRAYRGGLSLRQATDILRAGRGTQWDPEVVDAFLSSIGDELAVPEPSLRPLAVPATVDPVSPPASASRRQ